jgi:hypothetical protein
LLSLRVINRLENVPSRCVDLCKPLGLCAPCRVCRAVLLEFFERTHGLAESAAIDSATDGFARAQPIHEGSCLRRCHQSRKLVRSRREILPIHIVKAAHLQAVVLMRADGTGPQGYHVTVLRKARNVASLNRVSSIVCHLFAPPMRLIAPGDRIPAIWPHLDLTTVVPALPASHRSGSSAARTEGEEPCARSLVAGHCPRIWGCKCEFWESWRCAPRLFGACYRPVPRRQTAATRPASTTLQSRMFRTQLDDTLDVFRAAMVMMIAHPSSAS